VNGYSRNGASGGGGLEKRAAVILQPDVCYAGGITELKIIAGMAETYYTPLARHNPQGPCALAASLQIAASIPDFMVQERGDNEYAELFAKPLPPVRNGHRPIPLEPGLGITKSTHRCIEPELPVEPALAQMR